MRLKISKIISFSTMLLFFSIGQTSDALNYSNNLQIYEESKELLAKEGGNSKKSASKKSGDSKKRASKKSGDSKKSASKKSGDSKKSASKKSGDSKKSASDKKQSNINKVKNNQNAMKEAAKERYEIWKKNKNKNKNKI